MRTDANIAANHIALFGNTSLIKACELPQPSLERLEKIERMLFWNQNKIDTCNDQLKYHQPLSDFFNPVTIRKRLKFNHEVRVRLIEMWNKELQSLRM